MREAGTIPYQIKLLAKRVVVPIPPINTAMEYFARLAAPSAYGVPRGYTFILLVIVHNWAVLMWQAFQVGKARKQYEVKYPTLYEQRDDSQFNRIQVSRFCLKFAHCGFYTLSRKCLNLLNCFAAVSLHGYSSLRELC